MFNGCKEDSEGFGNNPPGSAPPADEVWMVNNTFTPVTRQIGFEETLTWRNKDQIVHKIVSGTRGNPNGFFESNDINAAGTFSVSFVADTVVPGTYQYYCPYHDDMDGSIIINNKSPGG